MKELYELYEWGAKLYIGGKPATPQMVEELILREDSKCMPRICFDETGNISEILY